MEPRGGTELQLAELTKRLPAHYWDKINLTTSVPEKEPLQKGKLNILWLKNSYDQPNIQPWFSNRRTMLNMTGIFLILIGVLKNIGFILMCLLLVVVSLKMHSLLLSGDKKHATKKINL